MKWQLQEAGDQFLAVVEHARSDGPQVVIAGGERVSVVLSAEDYDALRAGNATLVDQLLARSCAGSDLKPRLSRLPRSDRSDRQSPDPV